MNSSPKQDSEVRELFRRGPLPPRLIAHYAADRMAERIRIAEVERHADVPINLTPRERETLLWGASGKTSADIATILGVSTRTVNQHFENAGRKLGTLNRVHSVATAIRMSLI